MPENEFKLPELLKAIYTWFKGLRWWQKIPALGLLGLLAVPTARDLVGLFKDLMPASVLCGK